jgi:hypothetical protein
LQTFRQLNDEFTTLFEQSGSGAGGAATQGFFAAFGWLYQAKLVSEFEAVSLEQVWDLKPRQFLNDLTYIKLKREMEVEQEKKLLKRNG